MRPFQTWRCSQRPPSMAWIIPSRRERNSRKKRSGCVGATDRLRARLPVAMPNASRRSVRRVPRTSSVAGDLAFVGRRCDGRDGAVEESAGVRPRVRMVRRRRPTRLAVAFTTMRITPWRGHRLERIEIWSSTLGARRRTTLPRSKDSSGRSSPTRDTPCPSSTEISGSPSRPECR